MQSAVIDDAARWLKISAKRREWTAATRQRRPAPALSLVARLVHMTPKQKPLSVKYLCESLPKMIYFYYTLIPS